MDYISNENMNPGSPELEAKGHRLVVLGGGESGVGAAILGKKLGMDVFLSDAGSIAPCYAEELTDRKSVV